MKPTDILTDEHNKIKAMIKIFEKVCNKIEATGEVNVELVEKIVEFLKGFADKYHHAKEEDLLFPEMIKAGLPKEGGPISVMLFEHDSGREYIRNILEGLQEYNNGNSEATTKIVNNARAYSQLLVQHIFKEDNILYPMGNAHLSEEQQNKLLEDFEAVRLKYKDQHEKYLSFLNHLEKEYS